MKYLFLFLTAIFILFSAFQLNDPDPEVWIPLYGYSAVLSFFMFLKKLNTITWPMIGLVVYISTALYDWPETFKGMENTMTIMKPEIEKAREASGMIICALVMLFYIIVILKSKRKAL